MSEFLNHYSVDISSLPSDQQEELFKELTKSCWVVNFTDVPGVLEIYWESDRGDFFKLPCCYS